MRMSLVVKKITELYGVSCRITTRTDKIRPGEGKIEASPQHVCQLLGCE